MIAERCPEMKVSKLDRRSVLRTRNSVKLEFVRIEFLRAQYENTLDWYKQAEEKSKFLITVNMIGAGVINGLVFVSPSKSTDFMTVANFLVPSLLLLAGVSLIGSCMFILFTVWARHHGREPKLTTSEKLWFFGHIAEMQREDYSVAMRGLSEDQVKTTMIAQNHILACNVQRKFDSLNRAITLTIVALILLFALGVAYSISQRITVA